MCAEGCVGKCTNFRWKHTRLNPARPPRCRTLVSICTFTEDRCVTIYDEHPSSFRVPPISCEEGRGTSQHMLP